MASARETPKRETAPMARGRATLLGLCALLMAVDGPPPGVTPPEPVVPVVPESPTYNDADAVARVIGEVNPWLSPRELGRIGTAVVRYGRKYRLDPELVTAIILVESGGRPGARSPKGAMGLMQVMPYMRAPFGLAGNATTLESNIEAGCLILAHNIRRLGEDDGISSYFWGSRIRGLGYLERVRAARARVRRLMHS